MSNILAARFANTVALVTPEMADWANERLASASAQIHQINAREQASDKAERAEMIDDYWPSEDHWLSAFRPYKVENGTLMIPVKGMLLHDFGYQLYDWATGYSYILRAFQRGMEDPQVQRIAMVISSGGGEVAGLFDVSDQIYAMRGTKPILSLVNEHAYSAAYALASLGEQGHGEGGPEHHLHLRRGSQGRRQPLPGPQRRREKADAGARRRAVRYIRIDSGPESRGRRTGDP